MKTVYDYIRFEKYSKKNKDSSFDFVPFQTRDSWNESTYIYVRYFFSSNHNIYKSSSGHCFWASDPLIDRF